MRLPHRAFLALWVLFMAFPVAPLSVNRTIDDETGDCITGAMPVYSPQGSWAQGSTCRTCGVSSTFVNTSEVFDGTWHDTTYHPDDADRIILMTFTGHAVYIFHLLAFVPGITTFTDLRFYLDDQPVGQFIHEFSPTLNGNAIQYHVPVYVNTTLTNAPHTLLIRATGQTASLVLFDQVVYSIELPDTDPMSTSPPKEPHVVPSVSTYPILSQPSASASASPSLSPSPSSNHPTSTSFIVGASIAGVVALSSLLAVLFVLRKRTIRQPFRSHSPGFSIVFDKDYPASVVPPPSLTWPPMSRAMREDVSEAMATIDASIGPSRHDRLEVVSIHRPTRTRPTRRDILALRASDDRHGAIAHNGRVEDPRP
ncbi:hypothetical protein C8Q80DRAFT_554988 [Daedaleopsis nitida]|nr:hypothetical protein C8Q80DRAFT_554988 [Daedaleopsis nitida]